MDPLGYIVVFLVLYGVSVTYFAARYYKKANQLAELGEPMLAELAKVRENLAGVERQRDHYREFSEGTIKERDRAFKMFNTFGQRASVAQSWLGREVGKLQREVNEYRRKAGKPERELPNELREFVSEHDDGRIEPPMLVPAEPSKVPDPPIS